MYRTVVVGIILIAPFFAYADVSEENTQGSTVAQPGVTCPPGSRAANQAELARLAILGVNVRSSCIDSVMSGLLEGGADQDYAYFQDKACSGNFGLPPGFNPNNTDPNNWNNIRNSSSGYVYFSANGASMNPGALKCFRQLFETAISKGMQPCVSAALRSPAHQRSSCLDSGNSTVCGRSNRGTGPASSCPTDLGAYMKCAHVNGLAMDFGEKTGRLNELLSLARQMRFSKVGAGAADPWHVEAVNCAAGGGTFTPGPDTWGGSGGGFGGMHYGQQPQSQGGMIAQILRPLQQLFQPQQQPSQIPTQPNNQPNPFRQPETDPNPIVVPPTKPTGPSAADLLLASLKEPTSTTPRQFASTTASGTPVEIIITNEQSTTTNAINTENPSENTSGTETGTTVVATNNFPDVRIPTTFTSRDIASNPGVMTPPPTQAQPSRFMQVLENLKQVLLKLLAYLKPFGGRTPGTGDTHEH